METEHSSKKPGGSIDSWCGKCKLMLAHTIEAMVGDKPARVTCNTCKSQHTYKAQPPSSKPRSASEPKVNGGVTARSAKAAANRYQSLLKAKDGTSITTYSVRNRYEQGDVMEHATFGRGAVTAVKDGTKIEVLFETGPKTLVHAR